MASLIISIIALAVAVCGLVVAAVNEKNFKRSMKAAMEYADRGDSILAEAVTVRLEKLDKEIKAVASDITPNFEAAKAAVAQVNDLGAGLLNLFNYDPADALRASREEKRGG